MTKIVIDDEEYIRKSDAWMYVQKNSSKVLHELIDGCDNGNLVELLDYIRIRIRRMWFRE